MQALELDEVEARRSASGRAYIEFIREPALSVGWYVLPAGGVDAQQPHTEDEVYHVVRGCAVFRLGAEDRPVGPGSVLFAPAGTLHRFHTITEELGILVLFAPAEGSRA